MPREAREAGSSFDWLRHARSDLALARAKKTRTVLYAHLCFHAEQAAEKAIKAVLVRHGIDFPRTHDLSYLLDLLPDDLREPVSLVDLPVLTKYAVQQRYPGEAVPITKRRYLRAVELAERAVAWAQRLVRSRASR